MLESGMGKEFANFAGDKEASIHFLFDVTYEASKRISARILIDEQDLPFKKFPVGGEDGLDPILAFVPLAKEGYTLDSRADDLMASEIKGMLELTVPANLGEIISGLGIIMRPRIITDDMRLAIFRHSLTTILVLSKAGTIDIEHSVSHWPPEPSNEDVWELLGEIGVATRKMILDSHAEIRKDAAARALHFFSAGSKLAKALK